MVMIEAGDTLMSGTDPMERTGVERPTGTRRWVAGDRRRSRARTTRVGRVLNEATALVAAALALGAIATTALGDGEIPEQTCKATTMCGAVPVVAGPCLGGTSACCCRRGATAPYVCACETADFCQNAKSPDHCDHG